MKRIISFLLPVFFLALCFFYFNGQKTGHEIGQAESFEIEPIQVREPASLDQ